VQKCQVCCFCAYLSNLINKRLFCLHICCNKRLKLMNSGFHTERKKATLNLLLRVLILYAYFNFETSSSFMWLFAPSFARKFVYVPVTALHFAGGQRSVRACQCELCFNRKYFWLGLPVFFAPVSWKLYMSLWIFKFSSVQTFCHFIKVDRF